MVNGPRNIWVHFTKNNLRIYLLVFLFLVLGSVLIHFSVVKRRSSASIAPSYIQNEKSELVEVDIPEPSYRYSKDGWINYRNYKYGFEISYPENWGGVKDSKDAAGSDYILLNPYDQGDATVIITFHDFNFDIWSYVLKIGRHFTQRTISQEKIFVNGEEAEYFKITTKDNSDWESSDIFIKGDRYTYHLMMSEASPELTRYEYHRILDNFVVLP